MHSRVMNRADRITSLPYFTQGHLTSRLVYYYTVHFYSLLSLSAVSLKYLNSKVVHTKIPTEPASASRPRASDFLFTTCTNYTTRRAATRAGPSCKMLCLYSPHDSPPPLIFGSSSTPHTPLQPQSSPHTHTRSLIISHHLGIKGLWCFFRTRTLDSARTPHIL